MVRILVEGRGTVAFHSARLFFTPGKSHFPAGYLQPRAGHIHVGDRQTRSRLRYGINLSDPPWYSEGETSPEDALRHALSFLIEEYDVDTSLLEELESKLSFER